VSNNGCHVFLEAGQGWLHAEDDEFKQLKSKVEV
jgi:hypothetical protein